MRTRHTDSVRPNSRPGNRPGGQPGVRPGSRVLAALLGSALSLALSFALVGAPTAAYADDLLTMAGNAVDSALEFLGLKSASTSADSTVSSDSESGSSSDSDSGSTSSLTSDTVRPEVVAAVRDRIRQAILECNTEFVSLWDLNVTKAEYDAAYQELIDVCDAYICHWKGGTYNDHTSDGVTYVHGFNLTFRLDDETLATYNDELSAAIQAVISQVDPAASDFDKILFAHDWLVYNVTYDQAGADDTSGMGVWRTPLGALKYGDAVCSGYSSAFAMLLNAMGIECKFVESQAMNHSWNAVLLDGSWYYVDVTYDDPDSDSLASRLYFMVGTASLSRDHYDWANAVDAPADLPLSDIWRYSPADCGMDDVFLWAAYSGFTGMVDVWSYGASASDFDVMTQELDRLGYFSGMAQFSWTWNTDNNGVVRYFYLTF